MGSVVNYEITHFTHHASAECIRCCWFFLVHLLFHPLLSKKFAFTKWKSDNWWFFFLASHLNIILSFLPDLIHLEKWANYTILGIRFVLLFFLTVVVLDRMRSTSLDNFDPPFQRAFSNVFSQMRYRNTWCHIKKLIHISLVDIYCTLFYIISSWSELFVYVCCYVFNAKS